MQIIAIGAGAWGKNIIRNLDELDALAGFVEPDEARRAEFAKAYPKATAYADWQQALQADVDGVAIATPTQQHFVIAQAALNAGKDVFVEKPVTPTSGEARALSNLAEQKNRVLMIGHLLLFQPAVAWMRKYISEGSIGRLLAIRHERLNLGRVRPKENVIWDIGVHDMAVMLFLTGHKPTRVRATGHRMLGLSVEDEAHVHLEFPNGVRGNLHTSWFWPENQRRTIIRGDRGMLIYDEMAQKVTLYKRWINDDLQGVDEGSEVIFEGDGQPLKLEMQHFLDCIKERSVSRSNGESAVDVIETLEIINMAIAASSRFVERG